MTGPTRKPLFLRLWVNFGAALFVSFGLVAIMISVRAMGVHLHAPKIWSGPHSVMTPTLPKAVSAAPALTDRELPHVEKTSAQHQPHRPSAARPGEPGLPLAAFPIGVGEQIGQRDAQWHGRLDGENNRGEQLGG